MDDPESPKTGHRRCYSRRRRPAWTACALATRTAGAALQLPDPESSASRRRDGRGSDDSGRGAKCCARSGTRTGSRDVNHSQGTYRGSSGDLIVLIRALTIHQRRHRLRDDPRLLAEVGTRARRLPALPRAPDIAAAGEAATRGSTRWPANATDVSDGIRLPGSTGGEAPAGSSPTGMSTSRCPPRAGAGTRISRRARAGQGILVKKRASTLRAPCASGRGGAALDGVTRRLIQEFAHSPIPAPGPETARGVTAREREVMTLVPWD